MNEPVHEFPKEIGSPAARALLNAGITTLDQVSNLTDKELLALHGAGPKAIRILREHIKRSATSKLSQVRNQS